MYMDTFMIYHQKYYSTSDKNNMYMDTFMIYHQNYYSTYDKKNMYMDTFIILFTFLSFGNYNLMIKKKILRRNHTVAVIRTPF